MSRRLRPPVFPYEIRDQQDRAEAWYNDPLRTQNRKLVDENMCLKKLLRENGIAWPSTFTFDVGQPSWPADGPSPPKKKTRLTRSSAVSPRLPTLPVEVQLQIMEYSLTSKYPIIDPLSKLDAVNMTAAEKSRGNQIAIGFLATCQAYLVEGRRFLWNNNTFVFTSHIALRCFSNLAFDFRKKIKTVGFRIIARYYDDEKRVHTISHSGPGVERKSVKLKLFARPKDHSLGRRGFRSYTWMQTADFLDALLAPFDPSHNKKLPRPRLLPSLESMRIDFVNFGYNQLSFPDTELHQFAAHDLGCTLNELMITGLPTCDVGHRAMSDLTGMVKDEGLVLRAKHALIQSANLIRPMQDVALEPKVIRTWKVLAKEHAAKSDAIDAPLNFLDHLHHHQIHGTGLADMPAAPEETGHPESIWKKRPTVWKRVPTSRDAKQRDWVEFDRILGQPITNWTYSDEFDSYDVDSLVCEACGEIHDPLSWEDD